MKETYSVFRKYPTIEQAKELESLLNENNIVSQIVDNIAPVDSSFSGSTLQNQFEIKIQLSDFEKAEKILDKNAENLIDLVDSNHYLFDFTDDELYEILLKADEWNELDHKLAQKILIQRGKSIDADLLKALKRQRLESLAKPEENQKPWIIAGYIFAILGGLLGIFIGYSLWTSKKSLPNGQKVYSYNEKDRVHGKNIFYIGLILLTFYIILRVIAEI
ncbi:hypothetical protein IVB69_01315 [Flavobacterium sp. J49]|uniref:hypothetical protein n=1 Tax=Flavobacterium sp. J49 TaxID=2718534 RepID=UPI0015942B30|nr:hypothetical protein [Flavobacterium sp. J49]MBF6640108.1 hypothetical protein [Flavobacterium sp. J49]NIC01353.1 hypothetical protein [Flavobacterium sp. J49]